MNLVSCHLVLALAVAAAMVAMEVAVAAATVVVAAATVVVAVEGIRGVA